MGEKEDWKGEGEDESGVESSEGAQEGRYCITLTRDCIKVPKYQEEHPSKLMFPSRSRGYSWRITSLPI